MSRPPNHLGDAGERSMGGDAPAGDAAIAQTLDRIWATNRRHHVARIALAWAFVVAIPIAFLALGGRSSSRTRPRAAMPHTGSRYAPGVRIGEPLDAATLRRLALRAGPVPAPLVRAFTRESGDAAPTMLFGVHPVPNVGDGTIGVVLGDVPARGAAASDAPVTRVVVAIGSPDVADAIMREMGGEAQTMRCFSEGFTTYFWNAGRLLVLPTRDNVAAYRTPYAARLVLGARPWEAAAFRHETACAGD